MRFVVNDGTSNKVLDLHKFIILKRDKWFIGSTALDFMKENASRFISMSPVHILRSTCYTYRCTVLLLKFRVFAFIRKLLQGPI